METPLLSQRNMVQLKPYSSKELAAIYGVAKQTFNRWIRPFEPEIGNKLGRFYTVAQVKIIFSRLGLPGPLYED